ncbi:hypothetical protein CHCC20335_0907 [Bacillus paralicheniformis]|nr:hypothetical protein CHCC20335_0907 [Bacillus paralicheniformis]
MFSHPLKKLFYIEIKQCYILYDLSGACNKIPETVVARLFHHTIKVVKTLAASTKFIFY